MSTTAPRRLSCTSTSSCPGLRDAIRSRTRVTFGHEGRVRASSSRTRCGVWHGRWYVAGWDPGLCAMRRYRLERIEPGTLARTGPPDAFRVEPWFRVDLAFDLDPNSWGHDPLLHARARGPPRPPRRVPGRPRWRRRRANSDGPLTAWSTVAFDVRHYEATRNRILAYRGNAVVESPPALVELIRAHLLAIVGSAS